MGKLARAGEGSGNELGKKNSLVVADQTTALVPSFIAASGERAGFAGAMRAS